MLSKKPGPPVPPRPKPPPSTIKRVWPPDRHNIKNNSCESFESIRNNYDNISITSNIKENPIINDVNQIASVNNIIDENSQLIQMQMITVNNNSNNNNNNNNIKSPKASPRHNAPASKKSLKFNNNNINTVNDYQNTKIIDIQPITDDTIQCDVKIGHDPHIDLIPKSYQTTKTIQLKQTITQKKTHTSNSNVECKLEKLSLLNYCDNFDSKNNTHCAEMKNNNKKVTFHEMLISELTAMRKEEVDLPKKKRKQLNSHEKHSNSEINLNNSLDDSGLEDEDRIEEMLTKPNQSSKDKTKKFDKR